MIGKNWIWDLVPNKYERAALLALCLGLVACVYLAGFKKKILRANWFESGERL